MSTSSPPSSTSEPLTYRAAGVDIDEGARLVELIAPAAKATRRAGAESALGGFSALIDPKAAGYKDPVLLATTDGVGTKLKIAIETGRHATVGIDLVAMCVNDLLAQGAEPLAFLDYFATARLNAEMAAQVIIGIAEGCRLAGCALVGGETAEMPGMYAAGDYDLAGFAIGAAERGALLPRLEAIRAGDVIIGLASSGPHSNGYSLIRAAVARSGLQWEAPAPFAAGQSLADALLTPTRIYVRTVLPEIRAGRIKSLAHITGGGLIENTPRALQKGMVPAFDWAAWAAPPVFQWIGDIGQTPMEDLRRTLNLGIGLALIASPADAPALMANLIQAGEEALVIGEVRPA